MGSFKGFVPRRAGNVSRAEGGARTTASALHLGWHQTDNFERTSEEAERLFAGFGVVVGVADVKMLFIGPASMLISPHGSASDRRLGRRRELRDWTVQLQAGVSSDRVLMQPFFL